MLGTNDAATGGLTADIQKNLETIIEKIRNKNKDAVIPKNANANVEYRFKRSEYAAVYCKNEAGRRRAEPDLYRSVYGTSKAFNDYGWLKKILFYSEIICIRRKRTPSYDQTLFKKDADCGKRTAIANLFYEMPINEKHLKSLGSYKTPNRIGVSLEKLKRRQQVSDRAVHV